MPRKKEGRAARLAALERDANGGSMTSVTPETGEPNTAPDSVVGEEDQAQESQPKLDSQAEENRADAGEANPNGQVEKDREANEKPDLIDLAEKKKGVDRVDHGDLRPHGQGEEKSQAGDKELNLIELSHSDSRAGEKESKVNERTAEAIPA